VAGGKATIIASVFAWGSGSSDTADFFYTSDASSPNWQYIGSVKPSGGQEQELKIAYTLPNGPNQAVRVQFRYEGSNSGACVAGDYNDRDDIVFAIKPAHPGSGPQQASYDSALTVPRCSEYGSKCDSVNLLNGRGTMSGGNEQNAPNTIDECADGNSGTYYVDESVEKIVVQSVDGSTMTEGRSATVIATVYSWSANSDYADFYYASDAFNPTWHYIGTKQPSASGIEEIEISYTLPAGENQAVRVNFRFWEVSGVEKDCYMVGEGIGGPGSVSTGLRDDRDDLVFRVKSNAGPFS